MEDRCVCCGEIIPEGRQVCPTCEAKALPKRNMKDILMRHAHFLELESERAAVEHNVDALTKLSYCLGSIADTYAALPGVINHPKWSDQNDHSSLDHRDLRDHSLTAEHAAADHAEA